MLNEVSQTPVSFGIIAALEPECLAFKERIQNPKRSTVGSLEFIQGDLNGQSVVLLQCGFGKVNAAIATSLMIKQFSPQYVINIGSAGGFASDLNIGDVIISSSVVHHDVDVTGLGYELGQVPGCEVVFNADEKLQKLALTAEMSPYKIRSGKIISGDSFVHHRDQLEKIHKHFPDADVIEMEGASVAQSCTILGTKFLIVRSVSDCVYDENNSVDFHEFLPIAAKNSLSVVSHILENF